jgi:anaerobic magnesium-protoporphyrin IX monomethyl ester cyclase
MNSGPPGGRLLAPPASGTRERPEVVLIGYQDQGNLGMGYLAATLLQHGRSVELVDFRDGPLRITARILAAQPLVVGFSLIFQYYLPRFRQLARHLRAAGVRSHFTIGGHYPSLCHGEVLAQMPELDSVVRYEGELTLLDLVQRLAAREDWRGVPGIAYLDDGAVVEGEPRALVQDLDSLPFPYRPYEPERVCGFRALPLLASRGCARRCSFCSIHTFYRTAPGKVVRVRSVEKVVEEMRQLHDEEGVRVFLFQDDDFPLWGRAGRKWVDRLLEQLDQAHLAGRTAWKISCRAEYVEPELFTVLRDAGLYLVYMGIESGVESGLEVLHKQITVEQNRRAVAVLKSLGLMFEYGFMLFDPSSTFDSVRKNIGFLREIVGDGSAAATFCRMVPYGGTPIRDRLEMEGRLRGDISHPDYDFLDRRLNEYHAVLDRAASPWIHGDGISHQLNWAWNELHVISRLVPGLEAVAPYGMSLRQLTAGSNEQLFRLVEDSSLRFERGADPGLDPDRSADRCADTQERLLYMRNNFIQLNAERLLEAMDAARIRGPIIAPQIH